MNKGKKKKIEKKLVMRKAKSDPNAEKTQCHEEGFELLQFESNLLHWKACLN